MRLFLFAATRVAGVALLGLLAHVIGRRLTRRLAFASGWERWGFTTGAGLAVLSSLVFAVAALRLLTPAAVAAAFAAAGIAAGRAWRETFDDLSRNTRRLWNGGCPRLAALVPAILLVPVAILALYPPTGWDATLYHLASARRDVRHGGLVFDPAIRFNWFPQAGEMLFAVPLLVGDDVSPALLELLMAGLAAVSLIGWARRSATPRAGAWAAAFWLSSPIVLWAGSMAYVDAGAALGALLGAYAAANWEQTREAGWLALSGAMLGFAVATKPSAILLVAVAAAAVAALLARRRLLGGSLLFAAAFLAAAGPWLLRCGIATGDPVYPLFSRATATASPLSAADLQELHRHFRHGYSGPAALAVFWKRVAGEPPLSPALMIAIPLVVAAAVRSRFVRLLALAGAASFALWALAAPNPRFLLPILPIASLAAGAALDLACRRIAGLARLARPPGFAPAIAALVLLPGFLFTSLETVKRGFPPACGPAREGYLASTLSGYRAIRFLDRAAAPRAAVYALFAENLRYYSDRDFIGDWFGPGRFSDVMEALGTGRSLSRKLRGLGAGYLLVNRPRMAQLAPAAHLPGDEDFPRLFERVYSDPEAEVYRLVRPPSPGSRAPGSGTGAPGG